MYSKIKVAGHPVHPMLVAFPVACYTGTLAGFAVYAANGHLFWLNLAIALSAIGVAMTIAAGFLGWTLVQDYHVGIRLTPEQELAEPAVQHHQPQIPLRRRHAA